MKGITIPNASQDKKQQTKKLDVLLKNPLKNARVQRKQISQLDRKQKKGKIVVKVKTT